MNYLAWFLLLNALPLLVDAVTLALVIRHQVRGRGPSGIPFPLTLLLYACMNLWVAPFPLVVKAAMFALAVVLQGLLLFAIPALHRRLRRGRIVDPKG